MVEAWHEIRSASFSMSLYSSGVIDLEQVLILTEDTFNTSFDIIPLYRVSNKLNYLVLVNFYSDQLLISQVIAKKTRTHFFWTTVYMGLSVRSLQLIPLCLTLLYGVNSVI